MKFYSDLLNKMFDTAEECTAAEDAALQKKEQEKAEKAKLEAEKKVAKERVDAAKKELEASLKVYFDAITNYNKKYKGYEPLRFKWDLFM